MQFSRYSAKNRDFVTRYSRGRDQIVKYILRVIALNTFFLISSAQAQDALSVGYFAEWPLPAHYGASNGAYDDALGVPVTWKSYGNSAALSAALHAGEIEVILSQGLAPLLVMAAIHDDFRVIDISVSYPDTQNCVTNIGGSVPANARVALPLGTTVHFAFLNFLTAQGIHPATLEFINMLPAQATAALRDGKVEVACGWGASLDMLTVLGVPLLSDTRGTYDVTIIDANFGAENSALIARFLEITNNLNQSFSNTPATMTPQIASVVNMEKTSVSSTMGEFVFPSITDKLSADWMGGGLQSHLQSLAEFFVQQRTLEAALDSYDNIIDITYLQKAAELPLIDAE